VVADETGAVEQELAYYPFGETRVNSTSNDTDVAYKYTGQEEDNSTGLYFYQARYYDSHLGRFIQPDKIVPQPFNPQALNRYSYVLNNPLRYTDPTGYNPELTALTLQQSIADTNILLLPELIAPCCTLDSSISPALQAAVGILQNPPSVRSSPLLEFSLFGQKVDVGVSASLVAVNVGNDLEGISQSNFSLSVIAGISIGFGVDIRINPPSDESLFYSPFVGSGKHLSIGTNILQDPVTRGDIGFQGLNFSLGPSLGLPFGVELPLIVNGICKCN
jgi:RHS repeat-associated protein